MPSRKRSPSGQLERLPVARHVPLVKSRHYITKLVPTGVGDGGGGTADLQRLAGLTVHLKQFGRLLRG